MMKMIDIFESNDAKFAEIALNKKEYVFVTHFETFTFVMQCYDGSEVYGEYGADFPVRKLTTVECDEIVAWSRKEVFSKWEELYDNQ